MSVCGPSLRKTTPWGAERRWARSEQGRHLGVDVTVNVHAGNAKIAKTAAKCREMRGANVLVFPSRRRHTILQGDWSSDVCSSDLRSGVGRAAPWADPRLDGGPTRRSY